MLLAKILSLKLRNGIQRLGKKLKNLKNMEKLKILE
jgi:hypothetical protein